MQKNKQKWRKNVMFCAIFDKKTRDEIRWVYGDKPNATKGLRLMKLP